MHCAGSNGRSKAPQWVNADYLTFLCTESEGQSGEEASTKLTEMKQKWGLFFFIQSATYKPIFWTTCLTIFCRYGREGGGFDLDDLDEDFDDLGIDSGDEEEESEENDSE